MPWCSPRKEKPSAPAPNFNRPAGFDGDAASGDGTTGDLYREAVRVFSNKKPIVAAVQGAAIGGGLGLAVSADFRVTCPEARFAANFTKLGFHPGFGLTVTLPEVIGKNNAALMFYTSRRVTGEEAFKMASPTFWCRRIRCVPKHSSWQMRSPRTPR